MHIILAGEITGWDSYLQTGGMVGLMAIVIVSFLTQMIVPGWTYKKMERERDYYRDIANQSLTLAERQTTIAETLTHRVEELNRAQRLAASRRTLLRRDDTDEPTDF